MNLIKGNVVDRFLDDLKYNPNAILLHVVNCQGVMGSGVALEIRNRIPEAYRAYTDAHKDGGLVLGTVSVASNVCNMAAQNDYGRGKRQLNYGAFAKCVSQVKSQIAPREAQLGKRFNVYVPYLIGCDRAGGDWEIVSEILDFNFKNLIVCKLS